MHGVLAAPYRAFCCSRTIDKPNPARYRGKYAPIESMTVHNDHDKLTQLRVVLLRE